jgi:hypothetical protein
MSVRQPSSLKRMVEDDKREASDRHPKGLKETIRNANPVESRSNLKFQRDHALDQSTYVVPITASRFHLDDSIVDI